jgi:RNA polymerase sigma-70 factor (ECF subfamily)
MADSQAHSSRLTDLASAGDEAALGELAESVQDGLFRFALAHGLRRTEAAEATQETLLRAYRQRRRWRRGGSATAWLYAIAMNVVRALSRQRRRTAPIAIDLDALAAGPGRPDAEKRERLALLAEKLAELPPRQREAVVCRFLRQMSVREMAAAMGCA